MKTRLLTSLCIVLTIALLFVLEVFVSPYFFDAFFLVISTLAAYEMSMLLTRMGRFNNSIVILIYPALVAAASVLGLYYNINIGDILLINLALAVLVFLLCFLWGVIFKKQTINEMRIREIKDQKFAKFSFKKALNTLIGLLYPTFLFLTMILLNHFDEVGFGNIADFDGRIAVFIILTAFLIPMFTDSFAMLCGMLIGGKKLVPKISPNKTISGAVGGVLWGAVSAVVLYLIFNAFEAYNEVFTQLGFQFWHFIIVGLVVSFVCELGDLFESYLKRKANVKDSGDILPGHGGILDRMDSHIVCAPLIFIFLLIML